jgi:integrase
MPLPSPSALTPLGDYLRHEWLPRKQAGWASGSQRHRQWTVDTLCDSRLVDRPIGELTVMEIERYFAERAATPFPSTGQVPARGSIKSLYATLKACLGDAHRYGLIPDNPCAKVRLPPDNGQPAQIWSPEQVRAFLAHTADTRQAVLWRVLFATGMRRGEALGLTWRHVDLDAGRLLIARAMLADSRKGNVVYGPPKNHRSLRTISIDPGTVDALRGWKSAVAAEAVSRGDVVTDDSPVFVHADGSPMLPAGVSDTFRRQVKAAGLPAIPLHNARHCHISHLLAAGEPIAHVAARAGHSTSAMTLRIYAHVIPGDDARTAARAAEMFEAS